MNLIIIFLICLKIRADHVSGHRKKEGQTNIVLEKNIQVIYFYVKWFKTKNHIYIVQTWTPLRIQSS